MIKMNEGERNEEKQTMSLESQSKKEASAQPFHWASDQTKVQRGKGTLPRAHSMLVADLRQSPGPLTPGLLPFPCILLLPAFCTPNSTSSPGIKGNGASRLLESQDRRKISGLLTFSIVLEMPLSHPAYLGFGFLKADPDRGCWRSI